MQTSNYLRLHVNITVWIVQLSSFGIVSKLVCSNQMTDFRADMHNTSSEAMLEIDKMLQLMKGQVIAAVHCFIKKKLQSFELFNFYWLICKQVGKKKTSI